MKRNKLFLLGLFVVFAAVLSLSLVSSTFARYTSSGNGQDTARVAKWGVTVTAAGDTTKILGTEDSLVETEIVSESAGLLAPGTKGTFVTVDVEGAPEVAVSLTYEVTVSLNGLWEDENGDFYCPIRFFVNGTEVDTSTAADATDVQDAIIAAITAKNAASVAAGTSLADKDITLTWAWDIDGGNNVADSHLGDLTADAIAENDPSIFVKVICTVTQID